MSWYSEAVEEWNDTRDELGRIADDLDPVVQRILREIPIDWLGQQRIIKKRIRPGHRQNAHVITWTARRADVDHEASVHVSILVDLPNPQTFAQNAKISIFSNRDDALIVGESDGTAFSKDVLDDSLSDTLKRATLAYLDELEELRG